MNTALERIIRIGRKSRSERSGAGAVRHTVLPPGRVRLVTTYLHTFLRFQTSKERVVIILAQLIVFLFRFRKRRFADLFALIHLFARSLLNSLTNEAQPCWLRSIFIVLVVSIALSSLSSPLTLTRSLFRRSRLAKCIVRAFSVAFLSSSLLFNFLESTSSCNLCFGGLASNAWFGKDLASFCQQ